MITKYILSLSATFNPLLPLRTHKVPRLLLAALKPNARTPAGGNIAVTSRILSGRSAGEKASVVVVFKDGREVRWVEGPEKEHDKADLYDLGACKVNDVMDEVNRHSRILRRKEELAG